MAAPLASLDPQGQATILSYNVPEPISYSGRHFLQADLPDDAFTTMVNPPTTEPPHAPPSAPIGPDPAHAQVAAGSAVVAPPGVTVATAADGETLLVAAREPLSDRLHALTRSDVARTASAGQQTVLFTNLAGQLDYRTAPMPELLPANHLPPRPPVPIHLHPYVRVSILSPADNSEISGTTGGITFIVQGTSSALLALGIRIGISVDGAAHTPVTRASNGRWSHEMTLTKSGIHTIDVSIDGEGEVAGQRTPVSDHDSVKVDVKLDSSGGPKPIVLPSLTVSEPIDNTTYVAPDGVARATCSGSTTEGSGGAVVSVSIRDTTAGTSTSVAPTTDGAWSTELLLDGAGRHDLSIVATDTSGRHSAARPLRVSVLQSQPLRRLKNRFMLVETLDLSSFLGSFGAGRVVKTFTLLPGEETTISMKSWTKSDTTRKSAASIVDSNATEAADSFDDALSGEQTNSVSQTESSSYKVDAHASTSWGFASVGISGSKSGTANSARAETTKNVLTATRKHSMKASSNRNVTVNTSYQVTEETGDEESTTRKISNINASRTLNFVFRQMNQEHVVLVHLTNVRVAYYTEDLALDADGKPAYTTDPVTKQQVLDIRRTYVEYSLPELESLLDHAITKSWQGTVRDWVTGALAAIPDWRDELHKMFEWVTPTQDGKPYPPGRFMRFPHQLVTQFPDAENPIATVPGVVLGFEHLVMRTEGIMVDCVLGEGEGLDDYSRELQQVTIAERQAAVAQSQAEVAKQDLARQLVTTKDSAGAKIYAELFVPPPAPAQVPATVPGTTPNSAPAVRA